MGEDTLAATRLAIDAQRAEMERTADDLRDSLDLGKRFRENPALFIGVGVAAAFLLAGGPGRVGRTLRRHLFPTSTEKAYDALPSHMQAAVDAMVGAVGPRAAEARESLAAELDRWRRDPRKHGKVNKKLAAQMAEGPPGPQRAAWSAVEAGAALLATALARRAIARYLTEPDPEATPRVSAR